MRTHSRAAGKPSKPLEPAKVDWHWLHVCGCPGPRVGVLDIGCTPYAISLIPGGIELRKGDGTRYHIDLMERWGWRCDCPDAEFCSARPGGCKHIVNTKAALAAIGIDPLPAAAPVPSTPFFDLDEI